MDNELLQKLIDLIIDTKHECEMEDDGTNPLIWASNEGVAMMCARLQQNVRLMAKGGR